MHKKILLGLALCLGSAGATILGGGGAAPPPPPAAQTPAPACMTIAEVVGGDPQFSTLKEVLHTANLADTLVAGGPFTLFAPTDAAFAKLPADQLKRLMADPAALKALLLAHVVGGKFTAAQLAQGLSLTSVQGDTLKVSGSSGGIAVDGAQLTKADVPACNGVVQVIDRVLMPMTASAPTTADSAQAATGTAASSSAPTSSASTPADSAATAADSSSADSGPAASSADSSVAADSTSAESVAAPSSATSGSPSVADIPATPTTASSGAGASGTPADSTGTAPATDATSAAATTAASAVADSTSAQSTTATSADSSASGVAADSTSSASGADLTGTLSGLIASDPQLSTFKHALDVAKLTTTLASNQYTVFAPTNAAFAQLPTGALNALLADPARLRQVLLYHVVVGALQSPDLAAARSLTSVGGQQLRVTANGSSIMINDARVLRFDLKARNGSLETIDKVLMPTF